MQSFALYFSYLLISVLFIDNNKYQFLRSTQSFLLWPRNGSRARPSHTVVVEWFCTLLFTNIIPVIALLKTNCLLIWNISLSLRWSLITRHKYTNRTSFPRNFIFNFMTVKFGWVPDRKCSKKLWKKKHLKELFFPLPKMSSWALLTGIGKIRTHKIPK